MKALIIAAGAGTRFGKKDLPKPLLPVLGIPLIERVILSAREAGITEFIVVVGFKGRALMEKLGRGSKLGVKIEYIENPDWERGNGTSVYAARYALKEDFILLMADHLFEPGILKELLIRRDERRCILCIDRNLEAHRDTIQDDTKVRISGSRIVDIGKDLAVHDAIDCGIFLMTHKIFDALEESFANGRFSLTDGNKILARKGSLFFHDITGRFWIDVDDEETLRRAEKLIRHFEKGGKI